MRLLITCLFVGSLFHINAQPLDIDSLEQRLPETSGVDRVRTLNNIAKALIGSDPARMAQLCTEAIALAEQKDYKQGQMLGTNNMGIAQAILGRLDSSEYYFNRSLDIAISENDSDQIASVYDNLGNVYYYMGDYRRSLAMKFSALEMKEELEVDEDKLISSRLNIANVLDMVGDKNRAIRYYHSALSGSKSIGDTSLMTSCIVNLGVTYNRIDKDSSRYYLLLGLDLSEQIGDMGNKSTVLTMLGNHERSKGNFEKALEYWEEATRLNYELSDVTGIVNNENNLGKILTDLGRFSEALEHLSIGVKMANENGMKQRLYEGYDGLASLYARKGDYKKAFEFKELFADLRDSVLNADLTKQLTELEVLYESTKKEKEIEELKHAEALASERSEKLKKEKELTDAENARNRWIILASIGGLVLVLAFAVYAYRAFRRKKRDNHRLEIQNREIKEQRNEIEIQRDIIQVKNQEITDSIKYAKRIQQAILPPHKIVQQWLPDSFIFYRPKDIVAGDFYWMDSIDDKILFAACDCTGHGVPGAMVSVVCHNAMNRAVREFRLTDPGKILDKTRELVAAQFEKSEENVHDGMDIALCSLDLSAQTIKYAGANNPLWIVRKGTTDLEEVKPDKQPIGITDNPTPFTTHEVKLEKGDAIYIFSDGYADQFGGQKGKKLKSSNFKKLLEETANKSMTAQREALVSSFDEWMGDFEQLDDVCVIGVRV